MSAETKDIAEQLEQPGPKRAVALKYSAPDAPVVVAHGVGELAEKIIEAAGEHGVFIREDALLAEALGAVEVDEEIPVELFTAVAEVIGFVLKLKGEIRTAPSRELLD